MDNKLISEIVATAELTGLQMSEAAGMQMIMDLENYEPVQISASLKYCRMHAKGRLTLQMIIANIDDGRPTTAEAWAVINSDENTTIILNDEVCAGWDAAKPLMQCGDKFGARQAFVDAYEKVVAVRREQNVKPERFVSFANNNDSTEKLRAITKAESLGKISHDEAQHWLPDSERDEITQPRITDQSTKLLSFCEYAKRIKQNKAAATKATAAREK